MTHAPSDGPLDLFAALEAAARKSPNKPAIVDADFRLSYGALAEQAAGFSRELREAGIQHGDRVGIILPNGPEFVVSAFAIWKSGAVLVPLHARYQEQEILKYVMDCGVRALITNVRMSAVVQSLEEKHVGLEHAWLFTSERMERKYVGAHGPSAGAGAVQAEGAPDPDAPAVTQYSTGSTGFSKRVTRSHRQVLGEIRSVSGVMGLSGADRVLAAAPFFHSYGLVNGSIGPVLSGATVYAVNDFFPKDIVTLVEQERITGFPGVPFMYQLLADLPDPADFSSLRYALSAGAPLGEATSASFRSKYGVAIRQLYGSTETGVISIERPAADEPAELSVGFPIPGVSVTVVDDGGHRVPDGVEGLVAVDSPFAALAYDNLTTRSESHFRERTFFPGDLGRIGHGGRLVIVGRKRGFINVAGNKVDPLEVETVLREMPEIAEAVVVGVSDGAASEKIKAVLVPASPVDRRAVLEHCAAKLADFKRPRVIEFRKEIPKSPLGKILRKYLIEEADASKPKYVFDPMTGFRRSPDPSSAPAPVDLGPVSPFLRALLVTDGTVTKNLEAFFWEPIDVELLLHAAQHSERAYDEIGVKALDPILRRRVVLRGRFTGSAYAVAETVMVRDAFGEDLDRTLVEGRKGIGEVLRQERLETYRELVSVGRSQAGEWSGYLGVEPGASVMVRSYTISHQRRAVIRIEEVFPDALFQV